MSMTLLYGTGNTAKLNTMQEYIEGLDVKIIGLNDINTKVPDIIENGDTPLENARIKALAYYEATNMPVFSCDTGLYIKDDVPNGIQPGVNVRNVNGKYLNDDEMIIYYSNLAKKFGGQLTVQYINAICLITSKGEIYEYMGEDISSEPFLIVSKPHNKRIQGFPLDSLSVEINTKKHYYDLDNTNKKYSNINIGFKNFFINSLGI